MWENVTWTDDAEIAHEVYGRARPESARYTCPHCGSLWDDSMRIRRGAPGRWVATRFVSRRCRIPTQRAGVAVPRFALGRAGEEVADGGKGPTRR
ncbi:phage terminase large subunit family protein [Burkholderia thailandensis]|uniref:phage terminase large subunit family protein n=1 Tax=Burkholderia thailandensis TaxID=57975 RepID=UPI002ED7F744